MEERQQAREAEDLILVFHPVYNALADAENVRRKILGYLGLLDRLGLVSGTALAFLELRWKFLAPVLVGDTVHARVAVQAKRELSKPDRGIVAFAVTLFNQREEPVQEGEHVLLARNARK